MKIKEITDVIERFAPLVWQESYDNAGLIVGRADDEVKAALLAVDVNDAVLDEAIRTGCNMIITHHPIIFHPLKRFNSANEVQRCVERAICEHIALYACHTNLDSAPHGMSWRLASMLGVEQLRVLQPTQLAASTVGFGVVGEKQRLDLGFRHRLSPGGNVGDGVCRADIKPRPVRQLGLVIDLPLPRFPRRLVRDLI
ncbi:MAG: Nif3-like dinuclear metal center hexameric protein, partial [Alistipes sp.]